MERLEIELKEISSMFTDMAILVEQQGELIDQIEYNVNMAKDRVDVGNTEIQKAIERQAKNRKMYMCMGIVFLVIIVIVSWQLLSNQVSNN